MFRLIMLNGQLHEKVIGQGEIIYEVLQLYSVGIDVQVVPGTLLQTELFKITKLVVSESLCRCRMDT